MDSVKNPFDTHMETTIPMMTTRWISRLAKCVCLSVLLLAGGRSGAQTLNWSSLTGSSFVDSEGAYLTANFLYQLGTFAQGFTPTEGNIDLWVDNFHVFDTAAYSSSDGQYFTGTETAQDHSGSGSAPYSDYNLFEGMQAYIMIRNDEKTEFFLASASSWVFPTMAPGCCANGIVLNWSVSDLGDDEPIWGSQNDKHGGGDYVDTGIYQDIQTHAVPEPSALLLASLAFLRLLTIRSRNFSLRVP